jgi:hypothetical protein
MTWIGAEGPGTNDSPFSYLLTSGIDIAGPSRIQGVAVRAQIRITANFLAFFFGPIHYFVKDMWRKGLTLRAAAIGIESNRR